PHRRSCRCRAAVSLSLQSSDRSIPWCATLDRRSWRQSLVPCPQIAESQCRPYWFLTSRKPVLFCLEPRRRTSSTCRATILRSTARFSSSAPHFLSQFRDDFVDESEYMSQFA